MAVFFRETELGCLEMNCNSGKSADVTETLVLLLPAPIAGVTSVSLNYNASLTIFVSTQVLLTSSVAFESES